ncbi:MAG: FtsK/SpoIIIE domain-containing protein [Nannocystaceae bacterium]
MSRIYTSAQDEQIVERILAHGFAFPDAFSQSKNPKWRVLRLALAVSLAERVPPTEVTQGEQPRSDGKEYFVEQIVGGAKHDFGAAIRALLSVYHGVALPPDPPGDNERAGQRRFANLLTSHIQRGLSRMNDAMNASSLETLENFLARTVFPITTLLPRVDVLQARLTDLGIKAVVQGRVRGPRMDVFTLGLKSMDDWTALKGKLDELAFVLDLRLGSLRVSQTESPQVAELCLPRPERDWDTFELQQLLLSLESDHSKTGELPICLGTDQRGRTFFFDLATAPHLLVAGATGSGKSTSLHAMILSLAYGDGAPRVDLCLIDPKGGLEFSVYRGLGGLFLGDVATDADAALSVLKSLDDEMTKRQGILVASNVQSLEEGRRTGNVDFRYLVVVVEELADLVLSNPLAEKYLVRLATLGRASGIHLVLATQRPDAKTFSGLLRSNIYGRVALRVAKATDSHIILDSNGAESLLGRGEMLVRLPSRPITWIQGFHISTAQVRDLLAVRNEAK